ncbi:N-acetylmuramoyl-L-alanine amidase [Planctomicrobium piriforme]|uniref:N-acetylmuramoyl-L-alanine amidase n=1 Tax=Planctomicrobium piriforme TaxID=1576369 RepID=A0A1I3SC94_9PLAN|nr:N-acetylmuramoyl-L-alanine amidase [Planctomicrobium piriforme]
MLTRISIWSLLGCLLAAGVGCGQGDMTPTKIQTPSIHVAQEVASKPPQSPVSAFAQWQPEAPLEPWKFLILHHSATTEGSVERIDAEHRQRVDAQGRPWRGIGYHFVIGNGHGMADGEIQPTFRWIDQLEGAHAGQLEFNRYGIGICLIGNFDEAGPSSAQMRAVRGLVKTLQQEFKLTDEHVLRHGDLKATACPGKLFSMDLVVGDTPEQEVSDRHGQVSRVSPVSPSRTEESHDVATVLRSQRAARGSSAQW